MSTHDDFRSCECNGKYTKIYPLEGRAVKGCPDHVWVHGAGLCSPHDPLLRIVLKMMEDDG